MPSSHLIFCHPLLFPPSIFPSIRVFSKESAVPIRWPKYWSFSFNNSPSNEHPGLIYFRMDWLDLLVVQGTLKSLLQHHSSKIINSSALSFLYSIEKCYSFFQFDFLFGRSADFLIVLMVWSFCVCMRAQSFQSRQTLCNLMDCSLPGSSVHGFARQEYWSRLPYPPPGDLPNPGIDISYVSCIAGAFFTVWPTREAPGVSIWNTKSHPNNDNFVLLPLIPYIHIYSDLLQWPGPLRVNSNGDCIISSFWS